MLLLHAPPEATGIRRVVALFGHGLVGGAIARRLSASLGGREALPFTWSRPEGQLAELARIGERSSELGGPDGRLDLVWSAGKCGFDASEEDAGRELECFGRVVSFAQSLASASTGRLASFHLLSSAGGLFEGQRDIRRDSLPDPRRPYGTLKLRQELFLEGLPASVARHVYRPSSIYGPVSPRHRSGLVSTALLNGVRHEVTSVTGSFTTLRDYVFVEDVAGFVAAQVLHGAPRERGVHFLVSGRPTSIYEVQQEVQRVLKRRIYLAVKSRLTNEQDITFHRQVMPADWHPADLATGLRLVYAQLALQP